MKKYKSPIFKHIHQDATDMFKAGAITAEEMRRYDSPCLVSPADTPQGGTVRHPPIAAASPGPQGASVK